MPASLEQKMAEQATGCRESQRDGQLYRDESGRGVPVTDQEASELVFDEAIHDPNAGAGSFRRLAERLGFTHVEVVEWSSSAGDWIFIVSRDGHEWWVMTQENRHPFHGFKYSCEQRQGRFGTAEQVLKEVVA